MAVVADFAVAAAVAEFGDWRRCCRNGQSDDHVFIGYAIVLRVEMIDCGGNSALHFLCILKCLYAIQHQLCSVFLSWNSECYRIRCLCMCNRWIQQLKHVVSFVSERVD